MDDIQQIMTALLNIKSESHPRPTCGSIGFVEGNGIRNEESIPPFKGRIGIVVMESIVLSLSFELPTTRDERNSLI